MTSSRGILIVGNFLSSARGTQGICEVLSQKFMQRNWKVMTTSAQSNRFLRIIDMLKQTWKARNQYEVATVDVFSGPSFIWAEAVSWLLKKLNKPYILVLRGGKLPVFARRWPRRIKSLLEQASYVTSPSHFIASELAWIHPDICVLPNAIDIHAYEYRHRVKPAPRLTWLRAFHSIYNPEMAIQTIASLVNEYPQIKLVMYGPDKSDGSFQSTLKCIEAAQITCNVSIVGAIPKALVPEELAQHDIFLNTTTAESFGVSVMEAAALGMCIVTTNVGELPYLWTHGYDALLVPPNDPQAMADAVRRILTEPGLAARLSKNARAKAEQFDWSIVLPQWEQLLLSLIERHK